VLTTLPQTTALSPIWAAVLQAFQEIAGRLEGIAHQRAEITERDAAAIQFGDLNAKPRAKLLGD
jgi:hypothetical protein